MTRLPVAQRLAEHTTDQLCQLIEERGMSRAKIAAEWGCTRMQIQAWIESDPHRAQREHNARVTAGEWAVDEAERVLKEIPDNGTVAQVARARELAAHYRWFASKINPAFSDRVAVSVTSGIERDINSYTDAELAAIIAAGQTIEGTAEEVSDLAAIEPPETGRRRPRSSLMEKS